MKQTLTQLLAQADIHIDGARPWDMHVHNAEFCQRVLGGGALYSTVADRAFQK